MGKRRHRGRPAHDDQLTPTEWRTLHALQHGMTNGDVARRRNVSLDAIKYHLRNIRDKLGIRDRAALRRYTGIPKDSALARGNEAMTQPVQLGAIGQIARSVRDIAESTQWYAQVLQLPRLYTFGNLAFFDCGGTRLMLNAEHGAKADESILYLRVADIEAAYRELGERGVKFVAAPHLIHRHADGMEEWMAFFEDPEGRMLAIMAQSRK